MTITSVILLEIFKLALLGNNPNLEKSPRNKLPKFEISQPNPLRLSILIEPIITDTKKHTNTLLWLRKTNTRVTLRRADIQKCCKYKINTFV